VTPDRKLPFVASFTPAAFASECVLRIFPDDLTLPTSRDVGLSSYMGVFGTVTHTACWVGYHGRTVVGGVARFRAIAAVIGARFSL
jgi:hypothetical protein